MTLPCQDIMIIEKSTRSRYCTAAVILCFSFGTVCMTIFEELYKTSYLMLEALSQHLFFSLGGIHAFIHPAKQIFP